MPLHRSAIAVPAALLGAFFGLAAAPFCPGAHRPVVVYSLDFEARRARDIGLEFFDGGYFAGPALGGIGTFIFTIDGGPGERFFTTAPGAGRMFTVFAATGRRTVVSSAEAFETGFSSYVFTGKEDHTVRIPGFSFEIARTLEGTCLAARESAAFAGQGARDDGSGAGIIDIRANFQNGFTLRANQRGGDGVLEAVGLLAATLESHGFVNLDSTLPCGDGKDAPSERREPDSAAGGREFARVESIESLSLAEGNPGANDDRLLYSLWLNAVRLRSREHTRRELP